ncbi:MAG: hypothetical protein C4584_02835 [Armatimonadetes bacterium]|nr:MAG: hypothetical protein C4584_02835 [Armatimonadota bacterium]
MRNTAETIGLTMQIISEKIQDPRETSLQIISLCQKGWTPKAIAEHLTLKPKTVINVIYHARKTGSLPPFPRVSGTVLPLAIQGKTIAEISQETKIDRTRIISVINDRRRRNKLLRPTPEQTRKAKRESYTGKVPSTATIIKRVETKTGKPLTEAEKAQIEIQVKARMIPHSLNQPSLDDLYKQRSRHLIVKGPKRLFLNAVYAARLCEVERTKKDTPLNRDEESRKLWISMQDIHAVYDQIDPKAFERMKGEIAFINESVITEKDLLALKAKAYVQNSQEYTLEKVYQRRDRNLPEDPEEQKFLEIFYGIRRHMQNGNGRNGNNGYEALSLNTLETVYGEDHPFFYGLEDEIRFITSTTSAPTNGLKNNRPVIEAASFARATEINTREGGILFEN